MFTECFHYLESIILLLCLGQTKINSSSTLTNGDEYKQNSFAEAKTYQFL